MPCANSEAQTVLSSRQIDQAARWISQLELPVEISGDQPSLLVVHSELAIEIAAEQRTLRAQAEHAREQAVANLAASRPDLVPHLMPMSLPMEQLHRLADDVQNTARDSGSSRAQGQSARRLDRSANRTAQVSARRSTSTSPEVSCRAPDERDQLTTLSPAHVESA